MASIDHERKRISAAILFYGPPGAGKTTSLYALARQLPAGTHGKVAPLHGGDGRLLKLDYRPHDAELVYGYQVNFRLVACPGSIEVDLIRPIIGAVDAIMFVADSSKSALKANVKALELLDRMIRPTGRNLAEQPMVLLYNKRDLREAVDIRVLEESLNRFGCSYIAASAVRGQGVLDAIQRLTATVAIQVRQEVQASQGAGAIAPGNARTLAHGTTFQDARALHSNHDVDDVTAVSQDRGTPGRWEGDDDHTEVNPATAEGGGWEVEEEVAQPGDLTSPSRDGAEVPASDEWTSPSGGRAAARTARGSGAFRQLTPLEPEPPASRPVAPPPEPEPLQSKGTWRTPDAWADEVDSDDHTMPYRDHAAFGDDDVAPDDVTETQFGRGNTDPAGSAAKAEPAQRTAKLGGGRASREPPPPRSQPEPLSRASAQDQARGPRKPSPPPPAPRPAPPARAREAALPEEPARARRIDPPGRAAAPAQPISRARGGTPAPPTQPVQSARGGTPTQPVQPARGGTPTQPVQPARGGTPTQPVQPARGGTPTQPVPPARPPAPPPATSAQAPRAPSDGLPEFTATQVINAMGREPELWEAGIETTAHQLKIPVPDLAGYVVSRIGTPRATTRRTVTVPCRVTHMDTLMPQDVLLELDFRGGGAAGPVLGAAVQGRRDQGSGGRSVPMSWFLGSFGIFVVVLAALAALVLTRMG